MFLISSFSYEKKSQFHGVDPFAGSPAIGSSALCLPVNPLLASLASSSNAQDEVLEVVLDKLSELPATMRKTDADS